MKQSANCQNSSAENAKKDPPPYPTCFLDFIGTILFRRLLVALRVLDFLRQVHLFWLLDSFSSSKTLSIARLCIVYVTNCQSIMCHPSSGFLFILLAYPYLDDKCRNSSMWPTSQLLRGYQKPISFFVNFALLAAGLAIDTSSILWKTLIFRAMT